MQDGEDELSEVRKYQSSLCHAEAEGFRGRISTLKGLEKTVTKMAVDCKNEGQCLLIVGESGCGKTALIVSTLPSTSE